MDSYTVETRRLDCHAGKWIRLNARLDHDTADRLVNLVTQHDPTGQTQARIVILQS